MKVAVACGGTGGHIFPGLAAASVLRARGHEVTLWLAGRDVESRSTTGWDGPTVSVRAAGFPRRLSLRSAAAAFRSAVAVARCLRHMRRLRPDVLLAMGSYASIGPALAARVLRVPIVLHEANAVPGRAIAWLAKYAHTVAVCFEGVKAHFPAARTVVTGLPVRAEAVAETEPLALPSDAFTVLVMGGSQGAHRLNEIACETFCRLRKEGQPIQVVHLAGVRDEKAVRDRYEACDVSARVFGFMRNMASVYRGADLAISRSGAASCVELAICGVPALLVPLPSAVNDHQTANARVMAANGAMDMIAESELTADGLVEYLKGKAAHPEGLADMKAALAGLAEANAAEKLADTVERVCQR